MEFEKVNSIDSRVVNEMAKIEKRRVEEAEVL
jgi:hypothetical protein